MFHWICPECGREIAPTVRECPVCDPNAIVAEPALVGVVEAPPARTVTNAAPPAPMSDERTPVAQILEPAVPAVRRPNPTAHAVPIPETVTQSAEPILPQLGLVSRGNPLEDLSALLDGEHDQEPPTAKTGKAKPSEPPRSEQS